MTCHAHSAQHSSAVSYAGRDGTSKLPMLGYTVYRKCAQPSHTIWESLDDDDDKWKLAEKNKMLSYRRETAVQGAL